MIIIIVSNLIFNAIYSAIIMSERMNGRKKRVRRIMHFGLLLPARILIFCIKSSRSARFSAYSAEQSSIYFQVDLYICSGKREKDS